MKNFGIGGIGCPMDDTLRFLQCVTNLRHQRSDLVDARSRAVQIEQRLWVPLDIEILIEQDTVSGRNIEGGEESLVESLAANHVQRSFRHASDAYGKQAESRAFRQLFAFQKSSGGDGIGGSGCIGERAFGNRGLGITELCLPLRGRKNGAATVNEFQKVEALLIGEGARLADILARVGGAAVHV